jgi:predicted transcriptional regulator
VPDETKRSTVELAADIVSAFVSNNSVPVADLPKLIANVHAALENTGHPVHQQEEAKPTPAVSVRKSITPDYIISLEDGKPYKSMKRHLARLGLTPDAYREKWNLGSSYPMVAPNYAARRSEMAKNMGLGQQRSRAAQAKAAHDDAVKSVPAEAPVTGAVTTSPAKAPAKRARKKAT